MPTEETSPPGFLDLIPDPAAQDRLLLGIRHFGEPFLLTVSLSQGLGSSDLWLDRGRVGKARLAEFRRVGDRVLFVVRNKHFLTLGDPATVRAGDESFRPVRSLERAGTAGGGRPGDRRRDRAGTGSIRRPACRSSPTAAPAPAQRGSRRC
ncbi:hypothetical protein [Streptomyces sp. WM6386]|uniref:hypothetical protein n=1 Tax=Streptomyces sp. WM6386 TaxID=1415558 RepID=UPI000AC0008F|nr:hypothetical protein [Streptomyces sp. WM6386]